MRRFVFKRRSAARRATEIGNGSYLPEVAPFTKLSISPCCTMYGLCHGICHDSGANHLSKSSHFGPVKKKNILFDLKS